EAPLELVRLAIQAVCERPVAPSIARDLREPSLRVVNIALHFARRDRRPRDSTVVEALRIERVLPRLDVETVRRALVELDEPVAVAVAIPVDPLERLQR